MSRAVKDDTTVAHTDHPVAIAARGVQRVQVGDDHAAIFFVDAAQGLHHDLGVHRVERGDGFVRENDLGVLHQGTGDGDTLLLAA